MSREDELRPWLALLRVPGVGARTFQRLIDAFGSPGEALAQPAHHLRAIGLPAAAAEAMQSPDWAGADRDLAWLQTPDRHCLTLADPGYPSLLREIADPPPVLFVLGDPEILAQPQIAMVGSRNPSAAGIQLAHQFAVALVQRHFTITSGLALGIDGASHRGALDGDGLTVAVAGTGLDQVYPRRHEALQAEILTRGGAIVSEFPTGVPPQAGNFPKRNRIISGLSLGTLVVEAALRSGSLITAYTALEQNREVFAIPGSINNPLARGCNALIRRGAKLVEVVDDLTEELGWQGSRNPLHMKGTNADSTLDAEQREILKFVAYDPTSVDTLVAATGRTPEAISSLLLILELQGHVVSLSGGYFSRT